MGRDGYSVIFNSNNIAEVNGVWVYYYNATELPTRDINIHKIARRSLSVITSSEYSQKLINVSMRVCSGKRQDTEATITRVKGLLQPQNGNLSIEQSGEIYEYTATMNEFNIEWQGGVAWVELVLIASTPIATASTVSTLVNFSTTAPNAGESFIVEGSFIAEPITTITITSVTGGTGQSMSIFNASNNQGITITSDFTSGDIIEIDSMEYAIRKNGANIDFTGLFPTFGVGAQRMGYSDTFTTRNVSITSQYNKRIV